MKLSGHFPINTQHSFTLKGFDNSDKPYSLELKTSEQKESIFKTEYILTRGAQKESGSVLIEKEKIGKISVTPDNNKMSDSVDFETKITDKSHFELGVILF